MKNKIIAIIPARSGSKRIKNKNIIEFCGKPMIVHTIEAAKKSKLFHRIIVSTDSLDIAEISRNFGAEVPFLRKQYADDYTPVSEATIETVMQSEIFFNENYSIVCQLMAVCPLRDSTDILNSFKFFLTTESKFLISCSEYPLAEPYWAHTIDSDNLGRPILKDKMKKRSQDLKKLYCPSGAIWIAKKDDLLEQKTFYGNAYKLFPISWKSAVDIDNYDDLNLARLLYLNKDDGVFSEN